MKKTLSNISRGIPLF